MTHHIKTLILVECDEKQNLKLFEIIETTKYIYIYVEHI